VIALSKLVTAAGLEAPAGGSDPEITSVEYDSRRCGPGGLFVAIRGFHVDGHDHIDAAIARGAAAVVTERALPARSRVTVPLIHVADSRVALSALAAAFFGHPSRELQVAGVTGTDGKTTTATLLWAAWRGAGMSAGSLTTVDWRALGDVTPNKTRQTTLEAVELHEHLAGLRRRGCTHVALETSSHALELHRADDVDYTAAVFTRITAEHLELHGSREAYLEAKARLLGFVSQRRDGLAVLDATDQFALPRLLRIPVATRLTYSVDGAVPADLTADAVRATPRGVAFTVRSPWGVESGELQLPGHFNVANALAALATACATGASIRDALAGMAALERVIGRMERIDVGQAFAVIVDYAHTAESLETVLRELRPATTGRLWVVFGSAGERDVAKRPAMGAVAARLADVSVITDEDPREEDRYRILEEIAAGATEAGGRRGESVVVVPDRTDAIRFAVTHAQPGDTVLCAGKGHEGSLIIGSESRPWDERRVIEAVLRERPGLTQPA
jgi:UDP-N-acetylmuramoyl-L-alanyl-D-glutamate--2,6-diaminopimelate ligase